ncbi:UBX domain-containing protein 10 [Podospora fimiseda]|uniref:UBX domain-containing protein 10 n=1 Tax=Podospora fimiseda TaxID=252190 RepID=A0AAN6YPZ8_9PEZI|nr:UBX domain-containing protein 10 [Podospora fimiseda]
MATTSDFDVSQLSSDQQQSLQQYIDVTGQSINDAVPLLERSQWNTQIAIAKFFDGEGPDLVAEAQAAQNEPPRPSAWHGSLLDVDDDDHHARALSPRQRTEPAPRVVPSQTVSWQLPGILRILFTPVTITFSLLRAVFFWLPQSLRLPFFATIAKRGLGRASTGNPTLPKEAAQRFKRQFEEEYNSNALDFFEGGHAQSLDTAKKEIKFLLMVLVSPEHDETDNFIRNTLLSPEVLSLVNDPENNIIIWGGNVTDPEAHQVASEYSCTVYPFSCLVCLTPKEGSTRMGIVKRCSGPMTPADYVKELRSAIDRYAPELAAVRADKRAQEHARNLRSEQDSAYERSLALDRERARQRKEAEAQAAAAEKRALEEAEAAARLAELRQQWKRWRVTTIASEPDATVKTAVRLALNMPPSSGAGRLIRKFHAETTLEELYAFVECYDLLQEQVYDEKATKPEGYEHRYGFQISTVLPRETLEPSKTITLGNRMGRGGNLVVEEISPDEEEE